MKQTLILLDIRGNLQVGDHHFFPAEPGVVTGLMGILLHLANAVESALTLGADEKIVWKVTTKIALAACVEGWVYKIKNDEQPISFGHPTFILDQSRLVVNGTIHKAYVGSNCSGLEALIEMLR